MIDRFRVALGIRTVMPVLFVAFFSAGASRAQTLSPLKELVPIPGGLTLPIEIHHGVKAGSTHTDSVIVGTTTQIVPVSREHYLPAGAKLIGTVIESKAADKKTGRPAMIAVRFHRLQWKGQNVPIVVKVVAIANFTEVKHTLMPANGSGDLKSGATLQVGGEELYRSGQTGELLDLGMQHIGFTDSRGVFAEPVGEKGIPRALGVFSTSARGLYGFDETATLESARGEMTVTSLGKLILRSGDDLLVETLPPQ